MTLIPPGNGLGLAGPPAVAEVASSIPNTTLIVRMTRPSVEWWGEYEQAAGEAVPDHRGDCRGRPDRRHHCCGRSVDPCRDGRMAHANKGRLRSHRAPLRSQAVQDDLP